MAQTLLLLYSGLAAVAVLLQIAFGGTVAALQPSDGPYFPALDLAVGLGVGLAVVLLGRPLERFGPSARLNRYLRSLLAPLQPKAAFGIALLGSLAEELLFRGFLQPHLGFFATALLFGVVHWVPGRRDLLLWPLAALLMGLVFGGLAMLCGGILAPTVAHFTINYFNLHLLLSADPALEA